MAIDIKSPQFPESIFEGTLSNWLKKEGQEIKQDEVLAEIETDKATMEVEAVDEGTIGKLLIGEGTEGVAVNTPIAVLIGEDEDASTAEHSSSAPAETKEENDPNPENCIFP